MILVKTDDIEGDNFNLSSSSRPKAVCSIASIRGLRSGFFRRLHGPRIANATDQGHRLQKKRAKPKHLLLHLPCIAKTRLLAVSAWLAAGHREVGSSMQNQADNLVCFRSTHIDTRQSYQVPASLLASTFSANFPSTALFAPAPNDTAPFPRVPVIPATTALEESIFMAEAKMPLIGGEYRICEFNLSKIGE